MRKRARNTLLIAIGPRYTGPMRRDDPGGPAGSTADGDAGGSGDGSSTGDGDGGKPADNPPKPKPKIDGDFDPDRAARTIAAARDGEKKAKDRAQTAEKAIQELKDSLAVALGLKPDPKTDPSTLAAQAAKELSEARDELGMQKRENAVLRLAGKAGADPEALRDSTSFNRQLEELGDAPTDEQVITMIKDAVKTNSKLLAAAPQGSQGPARQGADITGSGGGNKQRPTSLGAAIAARMSGR